MIGNENEFFEHIIKVDEYMQVRLNIPKVLDALTFKAITSKANKLFNMSDAQIEEFPMKRKCVSGIFSEEQIKFMEDEKEKPQNSWRDIQTMLNQKFNAEFTFEQVRNKLKYLGTMRNPEAVNNGKSPFTVEMLEYIVKRRYIDNEEDVSIITSEMNQKFNTDIIENKVFYKLNNFKNGNRLAFKNMVERMKNGKQ